MININVLLGIVLVLCIALIVLHMSIRNKYMILYMIYIGFCFTTYEWITNQTIRFSLGGINFNILDILSVYLIIITFFYTYKKKHNFNIIICSLYLCLTIFIFSILRGLLNNSFNMVLEDIRRLIIAFFVPIICLMNIPIDLNDVKTKRIFKFFIKTIVIYCFVFWILDLGLGIKIMRVQSDAETTMRLLRPEQTLVVAFFAVYSVYNDLKNNIKRYISINSFILIITVILLQHRSVWVALVIGLLYIVINCSIINIEKRKFISKKFLFQILVFVSSIPVILFIFKDTQLFITLKAGLSGLSGNEGGTLDYRWQLWNGHLQSLNGIEWLIGKPFGSGYYVQLENYAREITPHNGYIHTIIRSGIIGIISIIIFMLALIVKSKKNHLEWGVAICLMMMVFWYPYSYNFYSSIILAFIIKELKNNNRGEKI